MSLHTSLNSDNLDKEYIKEVLINLPRFRMYCNRKIISIRLDRLDDYVFEISFR